MSRNRIHYLASRCTLLALLGGLSTTALWGYELVFTPPDPSVSEGAGSLPVQVTLVGCSSPSSDVTIGVSTIGIDATQGMDFNPPSQTFLVLGESSASEVLNLPILQDGLIEGDETFEILLDASNGFGLDCNGNATDPSSNFFQTLVTIVDDDVSTSPPTISIGDVTVVEGNNGTTDAVFDVELSAPWSVPLFAIASTRDGSAQAESDYLPNSELLAFAAGQTHGTFRVAIFGDQTVEPDEDFFVDLSGLDGPLPGDLEGRGVIVNDDEGGPPPPSGSPELRINNTNLLEGNAGDRDATFVVSLDRAAPNGVTVGYRTENGSARAGFDYVATSGFLSFGPNDLSRTLSVAVIGETVVENDETFFVVLEGPNGAVIVDGRGRGTIRNDDEEVSDAEISIRGNGELTARPGSDVSFEVLVTQNGAPAPEVVVTWTLSGDATLVGGAGSTSGSDGVATKTVRLGAESGAVSVVATLPGGASATFSIQVLRRLGDLFEDRPAERSVAETLDEACSSSQGLNSLCRYLGGLDDENARAAISELTLREAASMGTVSLLGAHGQLSNVASHLSSVRRSGQIGGSQVALGLGDHSWEPTALWRAATGRDRSGQLPGLESALSLVPMEPLSPLSDDESELDEPTRGDVFISGRLSTGDRAETSLESGFDFDTLGMTLGYDYRVSPGMVVGFALGYLDTSTDFSRDGGSLDVDGYSLTGFLTRYGRHAYLDLVGSWGSNDYSLTRNIDLPVPFEGATRYTAQGDPSGDQLAVDLAVGAEWGGAATFGLFGGVSWVDGSIDAYSESGGGATALTLEEQSVESLLAEAGVELSYAASFSWGVLLPQLRVSYLHEAQDDARLIRGRFSLDQQAHEFVIPTEVPDRDYLSVGAGFTATFARGRSFYLFWESDLERDDLEADHISGGFRIEL
ncbi:MAG: autotransporter domain-containing protein [Thermoanaerobaculia bacterium]|nr:autotransporter domain-containing protein [Thermoanaerobaculia bacterium]